MGRIVAAQIGTGKRPRARSGARLDSGDITAQMREKAARGLDDSLRYAPKDITFAGGIGIAG
jgi:hypothetical protein